MVDDIVVQKVLSLGSIVHELEDILERLKANDFATPAARRQLQEEYKRLYAVGAELNAEVKHQIPEVVHQLELEEQQQDQAGSKRNGKAASVSFGSEAQQNQRVATKCGAWTPPANLRRRKQAAPAEYSVAAS